MIRNIILIQLLLVVLTGIPCFSQDKLEPVHIGYFEAGPYLYHKLMYRSTSESIYSMKDDSREIYFEPYAYKSASWDRDKCKAMARELARMKNVDLILAAGPWVIEDLIDAGYDGAIVGIYQFDPHITRLISANGNPVAENLTLNYNPEKIMSDLRKMIQLFPSQRIGYLYFPSGDESSYMLAKIQKLAKNLNVDVYTEDEYSDRGQYSFFKSFNGLRHKIDALYLPPLLGMELDQINQFLLEVTRANIPTFTAEGFPILEKGATAGNLVYSYRAEGRFIASKILRIIKGASPSSLPVVFRPLPALCLNLESAHKLNIDFERNYILNAKTIPALPDDAIPRYTYARAVNQAIRENFSVLLAEEKYTRALNEAGRAWSDYLPRVNLDMTVTAADNEAESAAYHKIFNREFATDINLEQRLFSFPSIKAIQIAKKNREIEKINLERTELDLQYAVTVAYISVLELEEMLTENESMVDRQREYLEAAAVNHKLGLVDTLDISLLEEKLIDTRMKRLELSSRLRVARIVLNVLLNRPGDENIILDRQEFSTEIMVFLAKRFEEYMRNSNRRDRMEKFLVDIGIGASTDLIISDLSIGIQKDLISRHKFRYAPELSLYAGYSYGNEFEPEVDERNDNWIIGSRLRVPLFSGPGTLYNGKILNGELDVMLFKKDTVRFSKYRDIMIKTDRFALAASTLPMSYFSRNLSSNNLEKAFEKYMAGEYSALNLISLSENSYNKDIELAASRHQFFIRYAELLHSLGMKYLLHGTGEQKDFYDRLESFLERN